MKPISKPFGNRCKSGGTHYEVDHCFYPRCAAPDSGCQQYRHCSAVPGLCGGAAGRVPHRLECGPASEGAFYRARCQKGELEGAGGGFCAPACDHQG